MTDIPKCKNNDKYNIFSMNQVLHTDLIPLYLAERLAFLFSTSSLYRHPVSSNIHSIWNSGRNNIMKVRLMNNLNDKAHIAWQILSTKNSTNLPSYFPWVEIRSFLLMQLLRPAEERNDCGTAKLLTLQMCALNSFMYLNGIFSFPQAPYPLQGHGEMVLEPISACIWA